ncbi:MAG TPA: hypothetical protein VND22_08180 [Actinomycetota bacterium]|nr:hypothetical protein [Actinomycetota bacterium]
MLTFFSTPKPFSGEFAAIQMNAIRSWARIPGSEVILFGNQAGTREAAKELGAVHIPNIRTNTHGTPLLNEMFLRAQQMAGRDILCYANCDIVFTSDLVPAVSAFQDWGRSGVMLGRRTDVDMHGRIDFSQSSWEEDLLQLVRTSGRQRPVEWIDYFIFQRGTMGPLLPFAVGRPGWDNWLIWRVRSSGNPVVDATSSVVAVHQNHTYLHHPGGHAGVWEGPEATENRELLGDPSRIYTIEDANYQLDGQVIRRNLSTGYFKRRKAMLRLEVLEKTRPVRHRLGIRKRR